jgi:hypothetical protein
VVVLDGFLLPCELDYHELNDDGFLLFLAVLEDKGDILVFVFLQVE